MGWTSPALDYSCFDSSATKWVFPSNHVSLFTVSRRPPSGTSNPPPSSKVSSLKFPMFEGFR